VTRLDTLKSLQSRIREATGADRELDCLIAAHPLMPDLGVVKGASIKTLLKPRAFGISGVDEYASPDSDIYKYLPETNADMFGIPKFTTDPDGLGACVALCREVLPGYAWKVGTCCVSDDAWVVPDFNCPVHGDRLREKFGEIEWGSIWDTGIDIDRRPSGNVCLAFLDGIVSALIAEEEAKEKADV